jgi:hypothetical protein
MRKFLVALVALAGAATSVFAEVNSCDTMWINCVNVVSSRGYGPELSHSMQLACDRFVMQCRNTGEFMGRPAMKNHPTKDVDWPRPYKGGKSAERGSPTTGAPQAGLQTPNVGGGGAPAKPTLSAPSRTVTGIDKPTMIPPQLAERLRRLQQQRQY